LRQRDLCLEKHEVVSSERFFDPFFCYKNAKKWKIAKSKLISQNFLGVFGTFSEISQKATKVRKSGAK
jgi:hypothetical protein